ncbi:homoserine kinase [Salinarchaeum chitinilyticum]
MITVRAPATSANLGSGFDVFGVALGRPADVVQVEKAEETSIEVTGVGSRFIPEDPEGNTVGAVAKALDAPAHIKIDKGVRPASGLGSSAASAAGAALALNELYDRGHSRSELVPIAAEGEELVSGEAHEDNVAPALLGGFTVAAGDVGVTAVDARIPLVVCLPESVVSTRDARDVIPDRATLDELVGTVGKAATLAVGMCRDDPDLVGRGMHDDVVSPARAELIDGYDEVRDAALDAGATGVTVSGAGPGVIAACYPGRRRAIASAMVEAFDDRGVECRAYQTAVGPGATVHSPDSE